MKPSIFLGRGTAVAAVLLSSGAFAGALSQAEVQQLGSGTTHPFIVIMKNQLTGAEALNDPDTAAAKRCFVPGGNIQCARLTKMNGRNSSHTARLAGPDVRPPQEYASNTLPHRPGGPLVATSIHGCLR